MAWLSRNEFFETLVGTDVLRKISQDLTILLKQYEKTPKIYVQELNKLLATNSETYYYEKRDLYELYDQYKQESLPTCNKIKYPVCSIREYEANYNDIIMCLCTNAITFRLDGAKKWGIIVRNPVYRNNLIRCKDIYIYELVGLKGSIVNLLQIRNHVHHLHDYDEIVCLE